LKNTVLVGFVTGLLILFYLNSGQKEGSSAPAGAQSGTMNQSQDSKATPTLPGDVVNQEVGFAPISGAEESYSDDLSSELAKVRRALPTLVDLKSIPADEAHSTPARIIEAGAALGELEEYLEKKPEEFMAASRFFSDCASGAELPASVRAMCLHSLRNNPTQWAPGVSAKLETLPSEVVDLEAQL
jgi:hypothetical protein